MLTREQKEAIVIEMLKEGYSTREIAKEVHMSFSDIGEIKRRVLGESASYKKKKKLSKVAQALELLSKNKTPIEVAIELDLDPKDVEKIYLNYLGLNGLHKLVIIHQDLENYLPDFISFYWSFRDAGADNDKIKKILDVSDRLADFNLAINNKKIERKNLELQIEQKDKKLQYLDHQIEEVINILNIEYANYETLSNETNLLSIKLQNLQNLVKNIAQKDEYKNLEKKVEDMIMKILDDKSINLSLMLITVFEALRNDPSKYEVIFNYYEAFKNDTINGEDLQSKENYVFFNNMNLLHDIDKIYKKLYTVYSNKIISETIKTTTAI